MSITKTDYMRGMQCPRMLWLDRHHPEYKIIPQEIRERLKQGCEFGNEMRGIFGPFVQVKEFCPGTARPDKKKMADRTSELIEERTPVICEAAFLDAAGNYCAADILRLVAGTNEYEMYEVKNSPIVSDQLIQDAAYQMRLIRSTGLALTRVFLIYHGAEPYSLADITEKAEVCAADMTADIHRLDAVKMQQEEVFVPPGKQCHEPYECWYTGYCSIKARQDADLPRCSWCNTSNPIYLDYHDNEWGVPCHDDKKLYELFILESFQAGLSWEIILNKRAHFKKAYDDFEIDKVCSYDEEKEKELLSDAGLIRNRRKIRASIENSRIFREIQNEFGSFNKYLESFTGGRTVYESDPSVVTSAVSDAISSDLNKRGMRFTGSVMIYSYLQAIGAVNAHSKDCFLFQNAPEVTEED